MSEESVEIVRRIYDAGPRPDWDEVFRYAAPDLEVTFKAGPRAGTHRGRGEVQAVLEDVAAGFEVWISEPVEFFESGDRIVVIVNNRLRPKGGASGEFEFRNGHIWTIRNGQIASMVGYPTPEDALDAAGLRE